MIMKNQHWALCVIFMEDKRLVLYDSLKGRSKFEGVMVDGSFIKLA